MASVKHMIFMCLQGGINKLFYVLFSVIILICVVRVITGDRDRVLKKQSMLVFVTLAAGIPLPVWDSVNTSFLLFLTTGMFAGLYLKIKTENACAVHGKEDHIPE